MDDFCVILIGENDFYKTDNYVNIIVKLRETLQKVQNTNIIICVPTFKLSNYSILFNWRIETFNNLLYLDLQTYNYATVFDSNLDLLKYLGIYRCSENNFSKGWNILNFISSAGINASHLVLL